MFTNAEAVKRRAFLEKGVDDVFVQGIGSSDGCFREAGVVHHLAGLAGQFGDVAGVDPDTELLVALGAELLEDFDSVRHAAS